MEEFSTDQKRQLRWGLMRAVENVLITTRKRERGSLGRLIKM